MQLSEPAVGYGVVESTVDSGKVMLHPVKRLRTTMTYLAVALLGNDLERVRFRDAVNSVHRQVRSGPDSPVAYNAFDTKLQLWVAACLYYGVDDLFRRLRGQPDDALAEQLYRESIRLGTTLQVRADQWPRDRAAFYEYWNRELATKTIDDTVRAYFNDLIDLKMLPRPLQLLFARPQRFVVTGLLPPHLRDEMHMRWSERQERRLNRILSAVGAVSKRLPRVLRQFPVNYYLWDMRARIRLDRPLV
ncbi:DUF2236 domain-containing protein [Skermania sp. ID1734]|nr:DUF2236 domain-containing protein [Skermania sp. ID1734]